MFFTNILGKAFVAILLGRTWTYSLWIHRFVISYTSEHPVFIFFLKDNSEVTLSADRGILKTESNDIAVSGNVVLDNKEYKLLTEKLNYTHARRVLYSSAPVIISGTSAQLAADSISFDLNSNKITMEGSVEATIAKNFKL